MYIERNKKEIIADIMKKYDEFIDKSSCLNKEASEKDLDYNLTLNADSQLDKKIKREADEIRNNVFKIFITGEAKSGKSTFINAFLGTDILPTGVSQCTSSIIKIKNGENIKLIAKTVAGKSIEKSGKEEVKDFLNKNASILGNSKDENEKLIYDGVPFNIVNKKFLIPFKGKYNSRDIEDFLKDQIILKEKPSNLDQAEYNKNIKKYIENTNWKDIIEEITIEYPADYLKEVTIIDSPGVSAVGGFGEITEKEIKEVDAIIFIKSLVGQAMDNKSFNNFYESIKDKKKDTTFLVFTSKYSVNSLDELEKLKEEAYEKFKDLKKENIFFVDSFSELKFLKYKNICTYEELIDYYLSEKEDYGHEFKELAISKRAEESVDNFIIKMEKDSGIYEFKEKIETFMYKAPFLKLKDFLKNLIKKSDEIKDVLERILKKYNEKLGNKDELKKSIEKSIGDIKFFTDQLENELEKFRNEFVSLNEDTYITKNINEFQEKKLNEIKKEIFDVLSDLKDHKDDIKKIMSKFNEDIKNFRIYFLSFFFREANERLLVLKEKSGINLEIILPEFRESEIEEILKDAKEKSTETVDNTGFWGEIISFITFGNFGKKFDSVTNMEEVKKNTYEGIKPKISEIITKIKDDLVDITNGELPKYRENIEIKLKEAKNRYFSFLKQLEDTKKMEESIKITNNIVSFCNESITKFEESINEVDNELN